METDWKKKYEEALNRFNIFKEKYCTETFQLGDVLYDKTGEMQKDFDMIFPELCESEDERIRREIIDFICWEIDRGSVTKEQREKSNSWLSYLERQKEQEKCPEYCVRSHCKGCPIYEKWKEQKPAECVASDDNSDYDKGYRDGHRYGLQQTEDYMLRGGKTFKGLIPCWVNAPSELQPAHKYHGKNVVVTHENNGGFRCVCIDDEKAVTFHLPEDTLFVEGWRRKPAEWSEEDEKRLADISWAIRHCAYNDKKKKQVHDWFENLLKSLRPQPKQEWSEEDEKMVETICKEGDLKPSEKRWLKSLKNRWNSPKSNTNSPWKPSEEQMEALRDAVKLYKATHFENFHQRMESLYEQLRKLL